MDDPSGSALSTPLKRARAMGPDGSSIVVSPVATQRSFEECEPLSPVAALSLAQSCRKSPALPRACPDGVAGAMSPKHSPSAVGTPTKHADVLRILTPTEERRLLDAARPCVRNVYEHVRGMRVETRDRCYLPRQSVASQTPFYKQTQYMKRNLTCEDYRLLAYCPHILGSAVFGELEEVAGGWRWTFEPAGMLVQSSHTASNLSLAQVCLPY